LGFGIWNLEFGNWNLGNWNLEFGIWDLGFPLLSVVSGCDPTFHVGKGGPVVALA
jgi:hypothetical protein